MQKDKIGLQVQKTFLEDRNKSIKKIDASMFFSTGTTETTQHAVVTWSYR